MKFFKTLWNKYVKRKRANLATSFSIEQVKNMKSWNTRHGLRYGYRHSESAFNLYVKKHFRFSLANPEKTFHKCFEIYNDPNTMSRCVYVKNADYIPWKTNKAERMNDDDLFDYYTKKTLSEEDNEINIQKILKIDEQLEKARRYHNECLMEVVKDFKYPLSPKAVEFFRKNVR